MGNMKQIVLYLPNGGVIITGWPEDISIAELKEVLLSVNNDLTEPVEFPKNFMDMWFDLPHVSPFPMSNEYKPYHALSELEPIYIVPPDGAQIISPSGKIVSTEGGSFES